VNALRFLADEDLSEQLVVALLRRAPGTAGPPLAAHRLQARSAARLGVRTNRARLAYAAPGSPVATPLDDLSDLDALFR
jgi:hypothetical protein